MKTYSEINGEKQFNWFEELSKPDISNERWGELRELSWSWVTCACGNQCAIIPRSEVGRPVDEKLAELGGSEGFHRAIADRDAKRAIQLLKKIEKRSAFLIKQEVKKAQKIVEEYKNYL